MVSLEKAIDTAGNAGVEPPDLARKADGTPIKKRSGITA
jgi:hypothetical protein